MNRRSPVEVVCFDADNNRRLLMSGHKSKRSLGHDDAKKGDLIPLNEQMDLYLKEQAKMTLTVQLPRVRLTPGQCLSTTEVLDKLKKKARPHAFKSLTVSSHTVEFIRFEAELESKIVMDLVMSKLNRLLLKVSGFEEGLKVKCASLKMGPLKHEWEAFFRDDPKMDEKKPGHRPDTVHIKNLPLKWFGGSKPSTSLLLDAFRVFGDVKRFHIPLLDEMELASKSSFKKFTHSESMSFEAFLMYRDYVGFVKAMEGLRGVKLVKKTRDGDLEYDIIVDFDKTKHLSDKAIKKRRLDREYGIKNSDDMKKLKEDTKRQREAYEQRIQELVQRKTQARNLLELLLRKVSEKEEKSSKVRQEASKKRQEEEERRRREEEDNIRVNKEEEREQTESEVLQDVTPEVTVKKESHLDKERFERSSSSPPTDRSTSKPKVVSLRSIVNTKTEVKRDPDEYRKNYRSYFEEFRNTKQEDNDQPPTPPRRTIESRVEPSRTYQHSERRRQDTAISDRYHYRRLPSNDRDESLKVEPTKRPRFDDQSMMSSDSSIANVKFSSEKPRLVITTTNDDSSSEAPEGPSPKKRLSLVVKINTDLC